MKYSKTAFDKELISILNSWDFIVANTKEGIVCYAPGRECTYVLRMSVKEFLKAFVSSKNIEEFNEKADLYIAEAFKTCSEASEELYFKQDVHQISMEEITNEI